MDEEKFRNMQSEMKRNKVTELPAAGLCSGRFGQTLYGVGCSKCKVMRIDLESGQCDKVYECEATESIKALISLRRNRTEREMLAVLIMNKDGRQEGCKICVLEERTKKNFKEQGKCSLSGISNTEWSGRLVEMKCGLAMILNPVNILRVWQVGHPGVREFKIPGCDYETAGMCVMENVLGKEEVLALGCWVRSGIELFSFESNLLVKLRHIQIKYNPLGLLWIESKRTLLIGDNAENKGEMCGFKVTDRKMKSYKMKLDGNNTITILGWCVLHEESLNEKAIAIFDEKSKSLKKLKLA